MKNNDSFPCKKCGECCRHIDNIPQLSDFHNGDGVCIYLRGNLCSIYENRPDICNVEKMFEKEYRKYYTRDKYIKLNLKGCELIRRKINEKSLQ